jgi:serine/threonine protein kinase/tetratricopeptide (TPR) repeat protein
VDLGKLVSTEDEVHHESDTTHHPWRIGGALTMRASTSGPDLFNRLADEFAERYRRGERPPLSEYTDKYPELADEIRELFPALVAIEQFGSGAEQSTGPVSPQPETARPIPERLGDYRIVREIARGGMGIVYEAIQESLGRHVALKVLPEHRLSDPNQLERFRREARAAAMLHHTNIVPVFGVGECAGVHHYAMQYIQGQSLDDVLREVKRLRGVKAAEPALSDLAGHDPALAASVAIELVSGRFARQTGGHVTTDSETALHPPTPVEHPATNAALEGSFPSSSSIVGQSGSLYYRSVARIGIQAAEAIAYAHHHKVLHRDIKPSNLLLDLQGTVWVTDFGLAKAEGEGALTHTGDVVGTLRYMAPERFRGEADARSDVYALGLTLYEMLALEPAFAAEERARLIDKILRAEPSKPRQLDPRIPRDLETIILKAMAREPSDRYRTALELALDLRRFLEDKPITARRPRVIDRAAKWAQRHRAAVATGLVGLLAAGAIMAAGAGWIFRDRAARQAMIELEVNRALDEAATLQAQAKWPEALEAAKRAEGILAAGAREDLARRVRELRSDVEMVLRLEEIWMPRSGAGLRANPRYAIAYATAFRDYGIDVEALEPRDAAARIRARKIRLELALALDFWTLTVRGGNPVPGASGRRLIAVARAADPDEWRNQMRTALEQGDDKLWKKLLASAQARVSDLPVETLSLLVSQAAERTPDYVERAQSLLRLAQQAHPDDYVINSQLAWSLANDEPPHRQLDEAIRFATAALSLRPRNAQAWHRLAEALRRRGRVDEQIACDRKAIALAPDLLAAYFALSDVLQAKGQRDEAIAVLKQAADSTSNDPDDLSMLAWLLATSQFCQLRDPARAVELARKAVELAPDDGQYWNTVGLALYRAGSFRAAIAALEKSMPLRDGGDSLDWFLLAMSHWQLGERLEARRWYDRAVEWMENKAPVAFKSELDPFRTEAAQLLGLGQGALPRGEKAPAGEAKQADRALHTAPFTARTSGNRFIGQPADAAMPSGRDAFAQP